MDTKHTTAHGGTFGGLHITQLEMPFDLGVEEKTERVVSVPMNFLEDNPSFVSIRALANELGIDSSNVRRRSRKLGILVEWMWVVDPSGRRQSMLVTDMAGAAVLRAWYRR